MKSFLIFSLLLSQLVTSAQKVTYGWHDNALVGLQSDTILYFSSEASEGLKSTVDVKRENESTYRIVWDFTAMKDIDNAFIHTDVTMPDSASWWMLPSVSYNGNPWGNGLDPKGAADEDRGWWTFSYRRSPIPGATYSEGRKYAVATWSTNPQCEADNFSYSIMPQKNGVTHRLIWPEEEMPRTYCSRDKYSDGWRHTMAMSKGETRRVVMYVDVTSTQEGHRAVSHFLKYCWKNAEKVQIQIPSDESLWNSSIRFVKESLWDPTDACIGFRTGVAPDHGQDTGGDEMKNYGDYFDLRPGDKDVWRKMQSYQSGWVGRNISLGCALLADFLKNGDRSSLEMGISSLDFWAERGPYPNGLFRVFVPEGGCDACHMGTVVQNFIEAYHLAEKCNYNRQNYLEIAKNICDKIIKDQREDGAYGRSWEPEGDGICTSYEGFTATYLMPAMLDMYNETKDEKYLQSVLKAFDYFTSRFYEFGFTTAGALDTYCIDCESGLPFFNAAVKLYETLRRQRYLDDAVALGYYLSSWLWVYDSVYPDDDSFTVHGFHTFGAMNCSTQHQCLFTFGLMTLSAMRKLGEFTADRQWNEKADAIWRFCCQLVSDGNLRINGRVRPAGGQSEAFFHANWNLYNNKSRFDNWLVAWPDALRLEILRQE